MSNDHGHFSQCPRVLEKKSEDTSDHGHLSGSPRVLEKKSELTSEHGHLTGCPAQLVSSCPRVLEKEIEDTTAEGCRYGRVGKAATEGVFMMSQQSHCVSQNVPPI